MNRNELIKNAQNFVHEKWEQYQDSKGNDYLEMITRREWSASIEAIATVLDMSENEYMELIES